MVKKIFKIRPEDYGFPSNIGGMQIRTTTWNDFSGPVPDNTWFLAYTYWNTNYRPINSQNKNRASADVTIGKRSWTRALDNFDLLQHEAGHYWIACLCALEFMKRVNYTRKRPENITFLEFCQKVFRQTQSQYAKMQRLYDKQTQHYCDEKEQERWKKKMVREFQSYHQYFEARKKEQLLQLNQLRKNKVNKGMMATQATKLTKKFPRSNRKVQPNGTNFRANTVGKNHEKRTQTNFSIRKQQNFNKGTNPPNRNLGNLFQKAHNSVINNGQLYNILKN